MSDDALRLALVVGYLALAAGVVVARVNPSPGYDASIYASTPFVYWAGFGLAVALGLGVAVFGRRVTRALGVALAGLAMLTFLGLPFLRGTYFYGSGDALTHLGLAKSLLRTDFAFMDLIYPGGHSLAIFLSEAMGVPLRHGLMYAMMTASVVSLVFVPLAVWAVVPDGRAVGLAVFTAMLMLPMNNISTHPGFHSYTLTTLYFPFVLYLTFKHITRGAEDETLPEWASAVSLVAPIALGATVFYHPQVAIDVLILLFTVFAVGYVLRRRTETAGAAGATGTTRTFDHRLLTGQVLALAVIFTAWAVQHQQTFIFAENLTNSVTGFLQTGEGAGQIAQDRGKSADSLNISLEVLFVKLFGISFLYTLLAGGLVLKEVLGGVLRDRSGDDSEMAVTYIGFSALTLGPFFAAQFVGNVSSYFFRHLGFAMVLIGVLGAIALYKAVTEYGSALSGGARVASVLLAVLVLTGSLVAFYPSPYIYLPSSETPESQFVGYDATFKHQAEEVPVAKVRIGASRFTDALTTTVPGRLLWSPNKTEFDSIENLTKYRENERTDHPGYYLVVSERDKGREVKGFHGIRYQREDFREIDGAVTPRLSRVQTNGDYRLYYVDQEGLVNTTD
ncbi:hypothetical protein [Halopelagius longus]|uniref:hypothetical protein n=1 Tax=Halopelagius longus TaxID=1236180 RepID=UPI001FE0DA1D|nr:hypothetical protein [Halopelagius longus]